MSTQAHDMDLPPLGGRLAVVMGASRGIGRGIAYELAAGGADLVLAGRTLEPTPGRSGSLYETAESITSLGGRALRVRCDATSDADVLGLFARIRSEIGHVDILVNAAFDTPRFRSSIDVPFWQLPVSIWDEVVDLGTRSMYTASVAATPLMLERPGALIVNISGRGAETYRYNVAYGVGKAAVDRMTRDMAHELRDHGVAVVSIWPGTTRTEHIDTMLASGDEWARAHVGDVESMETPRYLGRCVVALACDEALMSRSGRRFWTAELAEDYGITDEYGRQHLVPSPQ